MKMLITCLTYKDTQVENPWRSGFKRFLPNILWEGTPHLYGFFCIIINKFIEKFQGGFT
jgi:hypothetical protein